MPFFGKRDKQSLTSEQTKNGHNVKNSASPELVPVSSKPTSTDGDTKDEQRIPRSKLVFHCQQAQGSPTGLISGFTNVHELYQKMADCYGFPVEEILFCTLNTHRIDMDNLLSAQLSLDDFIFIHRKGLNKEVEVTKSEDALGLTITDNGTGFAFIKRIKENSIIDKIKSVQIGDHIEKIDGKTLVGWRHVDVAKYLKGIPLGHTFKMSLVEPLRAGFVNVGPKSEGKKMSAKSYGTGKETLRLRNNGPAQLVKAPDYFTQTAVDRINSLLENFVGINDVDLATQIWEMTDGCQNTMEFAESVDNSELESFGFTDDFIIEVWGIVTDAKSGRGFAVDEEPSEGPHRVPTRRSRLQ
jgi:hypothetical protein